MDNMVSRVEGILSGRRTIIEAAQRDDATLVKCISREYPHQDELDSPLSACPLQPKSTYSMSFLKQVGQVARLPP